MALGKEDRYATKVELRMALKEARQVFHRKHVTESELRKAGAKLNKAVATLQTWLDGANMKISMLQDGKVSHFKKLKREKEAGVEGPLTKLTYYTAA